MNCHDNLHSQFDEIFGSEPETIVHAPGRVNLIGEHTDYNQGFVFPVAINFGTWVAASKRDDGKVCAVALDYNAESTEFNLDSIEYNESQSWVNYVAGVTKMLKEVHNSVGGANFVITGNVPQGAGLSSSASLEIAILKAFYVLYDIKQLYGVKAALLGQKAENEFVGCSCGIMDQLVSAKARYGHAMLLDCRSLTFEHTLLPENLSIMIVDSKVKRGLVDSEYNLRRQQCEEAAEIMGVSSLRDADLPMLNAHKKKMPDVIFRRAHHVITENQRTQTVYSALSHGSIATVSKAMAASHASMRDDFEVTIEPIDLLVELISEVIGNKGGVRMTGGGFGGCVVALVPNKLVKDVISAIESQYQAKTDLEAEIHICSSEQGAFS